MGVFEMVVLVVFIGTLGGVLDSFLKNQRRSQASAGASVQAELQKVRAEMAELRKSTHDVVLTFETTLQRLDARVGNLERQALAPGTSQGALSSGAAGSMTAAAPEQIGVTTGR